VRLSRTLAIGSSLLALSCRADCPTATPKSGSAPAIPGGTKAAAKRAPTYVVSAAALPRHRALAARRDGIPQGAIIDGLRVAYPDGRIADDVTDPPLTGGASVPAQLGGGFLFWSSAALYRAPKLLAPLEPLQASAGSIQRASFGPKLALLHESDGTRRAIELPSGRPVAMPLPGLVEIASAGPSAHLALADPARVLLARADGKFEQLAQRLDIDALLVGDDEVWLQAIGGRAFRLAADGSFKPYDRLPKRPSMTKLDSDPRWPLDDETPLERAIRRGVPSGPGQALVEAQGALARVDLASGQLIEIGRRFLPDRASCRLLAADDEILATCSSPRGGSFVASDLGSTAPRIEKTFGGSGVFFFAGSSSLIFSGPCGPSASERDAICARVRDGSWKSLAPSGVDGDGGAGAPAVRRWIPKPGGEAIGLVASPQPGLLELPSGLFTAFSDRAHESVSQLMQPVPIEQLVDDLSLDAEGKLRILTDDGSLELRRDGSIERTPHHFAAVARAGRFALARGDAGRLWQTTDWGKSWAAAAPPPSASARSSMQPRRCSAVGCDLDGWYRIGYPEPDDRSPRSWKTAPAAATVDGSERAELVCRPSGVATIAARDAEIDAARLDLGARLLAPSSRPGLRAAFSLDGDEPRVLFHALDAGAGARIVGVRLHEPFALLPTVRSGRPPASLLLPDLFSGADEPALPVVSGAAGDGWVIQLNQQNGVFALWIRADRPPRVVALGQAAPLSWASAVARGDELLLPMSTDASCADRVLAVGARGAASVLELPARAASASCPIADAIAVGEDLGVGVVRLPSGRVPPSADDPALLLGSENAYSLLAPWSELRTADAAECRTPTSDQVRVVIRSSESWLGSRLGSAPSMAVNQQMLALVRWSPTRICLEALELAGAPEVQIGDRPLQTTLVARFGLKSEATRRGLDFGAEYSEPLSCRIGKR
jgi:hypothetical protein